MNQKCTLTPFVVLGMRSEEDTPKIGEQTVSPSRQCSSTPVDFDQAFLSKEQHGNTGASP